MLASIHTLYCAAERGEVEGARHEVCVGVCETPTGHVRRGSVGSLWSLRSACLYLGRSLSSLCPHDSPLQRLRGLVVFAESALVPQSAPLMWLGLLHAWSPSDWIGQRLTAFHRWSISTLSECIYVCVRVSVWVCVPGEGGIINSHHLLTSCHPSKPWVPLSRHCLRPHPPTETIIALQTSDMMEVLNKTLFCLHILFSYLFHKSFVKRPLFKARSYPTNKMSLNSSQFPFLGLKRETFTLTPWSEVGFKSLLKLRRLPLNVWHENL